MKITTLRLCLLLCFFVLQAMGGTSTASAEEVYIMPEQELTQWQNELDLQKDLANKQIQNEKKLRQELLALRWQLIESKEALSNQQTIIASSQQALTDANKCLTEFAKEEKLKLRKAKWQRNAYAGLIILVAGKKIVHKIKHL